VQSKKVVYPAVGKMDTETLEGLLEIVRMREIKMCAMLGARMAPTSTKGGKSVFEVWMLEESDLIQAFAKAYGERLCVEEAVNATKATKVEQVMRVVIELFMLHALNADLAFMMTQGWISTEHGARIQARQSQLVKVLAPVSMKLVASLGVNDDMLYAPMK